MICDWSEMVQKKFAEGEKIAIIVQGTVDRLEFRLQKICILALEILLDMEQMQDKAPHDWLNNIDSTLAAQAVWRDGTYRKEVTGLLYIHLDCPFSIVCGSGLLAAHVRKFRFSPDVIAKMGRLVNQEGITIFDESFLNHLQRLSLRIEMQMPQEGTLLLPGQPLAILTGTILQVLLLKSALEELVVKSTFYATSTAQKRWITGDFVEIDTPKPMNFPPNRQGWASRAKYIGGGDDGLQIAEPKIQGLSDFTLVDGPERSKSLGQIRRLFDGNIPIADVLMTAKGDQNSSVSKRQLDLRLSDGSMQVFEYKRFMLLYQPLLVKGHPVLASPQLAIRRQRVLHQMESFAGPILKNYLTGTEA
jgi:hypothetical protein